jgi:DNA polymerase-3 subunit alpha
MVEDEFGDDFYVQIQNHQMDEEDYVNEVLLNLRINTM